MLHRRTHHEGIHFGNDSRQAWYSRGQHGYFSLQDVRVPKENLVGEEGEGFKIAMFALEQEDSRGRGRYGSDSRFP